MGPQNRWTVSRLLGALACVLLAFTAVIGVASTVNSRRQGTLVRELAEQPSVRLALQMKNAMLSEAFFVMEYLSSKEADASRSARVAAGEFDRACAALAALPLPAAERAALDRATALQRTYAAGMSELITHVEAGRIDAGYRIDDDTLGPIEGELTEITDALAASRLQAMERYSAEASRLGTLGTILGWALPLAALIVGGMVAFAISRRLTRALSASADAIRAGNEKVATASRQVASASDAIARGVTEQAASVEETSASMQQVSEMARRNAEHAHAVSATVAATERAVADSNAAIDEMVASMTAITESSGKVAKIIRTIDEIAFQTNILALNAAVEAARAGDAGLGFAVVADEVRALAQRSAQAAHDTSTLIEESTLRARTGSERVAQVQQAIVRMTEGTARVKQLIDEMSAAGAQQAQSVAQVMQAVIQIEQITHTTAATAEESAAVSQELSAQADVSMEVVAQLSGLVHGSAAARPPQQANGHDARPAFIRERRMKAAAAVLLTTLLGAGMADAQSMEADPVPPAADAEDAGVSTPPAWPGFSGIEFGASHTSDWSRLSSGDMRASVTRSLAAAGVTIDVATLGGPAGSRAFVEVIAKYGGNAGSLFDGFQGVSNIDADNFGSLGEAWFEQMWPAAHLRLKVGRVDANSEFAAVEQAGSFLNPSMGYSPTIIGMPTYPAPVMSASLFLDRTRWFASVGVFDGSSGDVAGRHSMFAIAEGGVRWALGGRPGRALVGRSQHHGDVAPVDEWDAPGPAGGPYAVVEQVFWRSAREDGGVVAGFAQAGTAGPRYSPIDRHLGAGVTWTGWLPVRAADVLGLGVTSVRFTPAHRACTGAYGREVAVGPFATVQVTPFFAVTPDLQMVSNPGGLASNRIVVAFTVRSAISF